MLMPPINGLSYLLVIVNAKNYLKKSVLDSYDDLDNGRMRVTRDAKI